MNRIPQKLKQGWAMYIASKRHAGSGARDFYGTAYLVHTDGSLRRVGTKVKHQTKK